MFFRKRSRATSSAKKMERMLAHLSSIQPWQDTIIENVVGFLHGRVKHLLPKEPVIIPSENLFIVPKQSLVEYGYGSMWVGGYLPEERLIVLSDQFASNHSALVHGTIHEATHFMAEKGWQKDFMHLEEGVVCEITRRVQTQYIRHLPREDKRSFRKSLMCAVRKAAVEISVEDVAYVSENLVCPYVHRSEHMLLLDLCSAIKERFPRKFPTEDDAFSVFEEAHFTGRTQFLEHVFDCTFGRKMFRFLGYINQRVRGRMGDFVCALIADKLHLPSRRLLQKRMLTMLARMP